MSPQLFELAVDLILEREKRYHELAYYFLKEALDFTLWRVAQDNGGQFRQVTGQELSLGFRDLALEQFGSGTSSLMLKWGLRGSADIGEMVYLLIDAQILCKLDSDKKEDFAAVFDFDDLQHEGGPEDERT
ncbi:Minf_1886 family protein [Luteolibacter soli]|uniref:Minf_1886 family protein n=1 Tax=Luteolibacter soli TaxID=3135280 RepID=A0ABU9AVX1_9BACT